MTPRVDSPRDLPRDPERDRVRDHALINRIRAGDDSALAELMQLHAVWLVDSVLPIVGTMDLAQDVVQDVFIRIWDLRARLEIRSAVTAYLYRAVRNRAQDVRAREHTQRQIEARMAADHTQITHAENAGPATLMSDEFQRQLEQALLTLQPRTREIFQLRAIHGFRYEEIADMLGIGVPTIHVQMSRAMRQLAEAMNNEMGHETDRV